MNRRPARPARVLVAALCTTTFIAGCQHRLPETPRVLAATGPAAFDDTPPAFQTPDMPVVYVTDRTPVTDGPQGARYSDERCRDIHYGIATVAFGHEATWDALVRDSTTEDRRTIYRPVVTSVEQRGTLTFLGSRMRVENGRIVYTKDAIADAETEANALNDMLTPWLDAGNDEVLIYVHGVANSFDAVLQRTAEMWHFSGRRFIPIAYSWPSGAKTGLFGYTHDRESSEFTVFHLKLLLRALSLNDRIKGVHIVAHSRGTDVTSSAIREIYAQFERGAGHRVSELFKLRTVVLAAPDIDSDVFVQRFFSENAAMAPDRFAIYFSPKDEAIGLSNWLFRGTRRMGRLRAEDFGALGRELLPQVPSIELIECNLSGVDSHSYLFEHPGAYSDLILLLEGVPAGDPRRPLGREHPWMWTLDNDYLAHPATQ